MQESQRHDARRPPRPVRMSFEAILTRHDEQSGFKRGDPF